MESRGGGATGGTCLAEEHGVRGIGRVHGVLFQPAVLGEAAAGDGAAGLGAQHHGATLRQAAGLSGLGAREATRL